MKPDERAAAEETAKPQGKIKAKAPERPAPAPQGPAAPAPDAQRPDDAPGAQDAPQGPMSEQAIRDAGLTIDVPFEVPDAEPKRLSYAEGTAEEWTPPPGLTIGGIPWEQLPPLGGETAAPADAQQQNPKEEENTDGTS